MYLKQKRAKSSENNLGYIKKVLKYKGKKRCDPKGWLSELLGYEKFIKDGVRELKLVAVLCLA